MAGSTAVMASAAGISSAYADTPPAARRGRRTATFVFANGANGSSSTPNDLALRGHRCVGVELPGQAAADGQFRLSYQAPQDLAALATEPSPLIGVTPRDHLGATVDVVRRAALLGDPVVLVGSSIGGAITSLVANEVPHLIDKLVYDTAFCCVDLPTPNEYLSTPEGSATEAGSLLGFLVADPAVVGAVRSNWRTADREVLAAAKHALLDDGTQAEFLAFLNQLAPDELLTTSDTDSRGQRETWGRIPRAYIRHTRDLFLPLALQDRMIREADRLTPHNRFEVYDLDCAHLLSARLHEHYIDVLDRLAPC
ncbi:alpha/beta fold hydrolase [Amycolatopsis marina]|nr:alpha/beta hydrolase [Amycolatopsis marina]